MVKIGKRVSLLWKYLFSLVEDFSLILKLLYVILEIFIVRVRVEIGRV